MWDIIPENTTYELQEWRKEASWGYVIEQVYNWASLGAQLVKNPSAMQKTPVGFLGREDPLEKG